VNTASALESSGLTAATKGFALAAAVTVLFNTALAWTKDAYAPLQDSMTALSGHHWTTHGLADLVVFAGLGIIFTRVRVVASVVGKMDSARAIGILVGAVTAAGLGLVVWFVVH
jgi:hypothetical protein